MKTRTRLVSLCAAVGRFSVSNVPTRLMGLVLLRVPPSCPVSEQEGRLTRVTGPRAYRKPTVSIPRLIRALLAPALRHTSRGCRPQREPRAAFLVIAPLQPFLAAARGDDRLKPARPCGSTSLCSQEEAADVTRRSP